MTSKNEGDLEKFNSISKRLKYLVDTMGVKQSHMAEKLGLSPSGLHYILNNDVKFSKNTQKIADYLKVNEEWLSSGKGEIYRENTSIKTYKIPIYFPDQLILYYRSKEKAEINTNDFFITTSTYPNTTIAIYLTDTSFAPKFELGDIIVFEQEGDFRDGEILLLYLAKSNSLALKYGVTANKNVLLFSHDTAPIELSPKSGDIIIGCYRECHKKTNF